MKYIIFDNSANGFPYVTESGKNTGCTESAWIFDSEQEAQKVINASGWKEWAVVMPLN